MCDNEKVVDVLLIPILHVAVSRDTEYTRNFAIFSLEYFFDHNVVSLMCYL